MAILKCKICGGDMDISPDKTFGTCEYCGSTTTFPKVSDEQRAALFNRGNHFRRAGEFDKALAIYENIVREDDSDAEAHWCCAISRFGIEYVEDPDTYEFVPTCHRASFDSFLDDVDCIAAIENSEGVTRRQYQKEAAKIAEVQRGILATSQNEEPFDVFICYKETDDTTKERTKDSIDAQEIYYQLTNEGYRVFFARITLEDKAGAEYEPYIFAALNSAKVMVVLGTRPEYFNAVWVKNEWSRFLAMMRKDRSKLLLPCYKEMDAYDLPEQLSVLQSYDMSKIGFIQDLIRGIKKVVEKTETAHEIKETVVINQGGADAAPLLERAFMFLEDGEWEKADDFCEQVLNAEPKNAQAYLGKLMAELRVHKKEALKDVKEPFDGKNNYQKVVRFGGDALSSELEGFINHIKDRNENDRLTGIYNGAVSAMNAANTESSYRAAAEKFKSIPGFKNSNELAEKCLEKAEICRKEYTYKSGKDLISWSNENNLQAAINELEKIRGYKDADELISNCQSRIEEIKAKQEADRLERERQDEQRRIAAEKAAKKRKKIIAITTPIVIACIAFLVVLTTVIIPNGKIKSKYNSAVNLYNEGKYEEAIAAFSELNGYKDSDAQIEKCYIGKYGEEKYNFFKNAKVGDSCFFGLYEQDNDASNGKEKIEWIVLDKDGMSLLLISKYTLDCQRYNTSYTDVTWETCSLRKWMNSTFIKTAFSPEEQKSIISSTVTSDSKDLLWPTSHCNNTIDKIFLLSITEVLKYFSPDEARKCAPTDYAIAQGASTNYEYSIEGKATCWWWLRSPCTLSNYASNVNYNGVVDAVGDRVDYNDAAVRPALWINLE